MKPALWWLLGVLLLPVLLAQGRRTRRTTERLPEAQGETIGQAGDGEPLLRLLVIGESPVAGVGVKTYEEALAAQLARCLSVRLARPVQWRALGENGADAVRVLAHLVPRVRAPCDLALVVLGVNDTTHFTSVRRWRECVRAIVDALRAAGAGEVILAGVPPMGRFTALPQPLRFWIGLRAATLDAELRQVAAREPGVRYVAVPALVAPEHLARDGYHPSAAGCAAWSERLADALASQSAR